MAKRTSAPTEIRKAHLIISTEEFTSKLRDRISEGEKLKTMKVTPLPRRYNGYGFNGSQRFGTEYVQEEYDAFYNAYRKWTDFNAEFLKQSFDIPNNEYHSSYESAGQSFFLTGTEDLVEEYRDKIKSKLINLESLLEKSVLIPCDISVSNTTNICNVDMQKIFIVHGHGDSLKIDTARTVERLGLNAIILHEQEDSGKTIIEKFEDETSKIGFAIVLLTADDFGISKRDLETSKEKGIDAKYCVRARQNVVFEMGYFIGKLDRSHVFLLLENGVEKPGDLDGIIYTPIDSEGMWKMKLAKRLKSVGYEINVNNIL